MAPLMGISKLSRLSLLYLISSIISASQASVILFRQAPTCGGISNLAQCGNGFPSDFCCPTGSTCMSFTGSGVTSVVCCPKGSDCSTIQPLTCDVSQFNATLHPDNQIHVPNTDVTLAKCGTNQCCPPGFKCSGNVCTKDDSSPSASASPTAPATPSSTEGPNASQTTGASPAQISSANSGFNGRSFAVGFFPGIVLGGLLVVGLIWVIKKRREREYKTRFSGDFGHVARTISDPIYDPMHAARVDFIRRGSQSVQHSPSSVTEMVPKPAPSQGGLTPKIKSMWARSPKIGFGGGFKSGLPANPAPPAALRAGNSGRDPYQTPTPSRGRRPSIGTTSISGKNNRPLVTRSTSTETIDVGLLQPAPAFLQPPKAPGMRENRMTQDSGYTTFTKLMERAGYEEDSRNEVRDWQGSPSKMR